jgi:hypothetical protein
LAAEGRKIGSKQWTVFNKQKPLKVVRLSRADFQDSSVRIWDSFLLKPPSPAAIIE